MIADKMDRGKAKATPCNREMKRRRRTYYMETDCDAGRIQQVAPDAAASDAYVQCMPGY